MPTTVTGVFMAGHLNGSGKSPSALGTRTAAG
jgi:hypothetical protein